MFEMCINSKHSLLYEQNIETFLYREFYILNIWITTIGDMLELAVNEILKKKKKNAI